MSRQDWVTGALAEKSLFPLEGALGPSELKRVAGAVFLSLCGPFFDVPLVRVFFSLPRIHLLHSFAHASFGFKSPLPASLAVPAMITSHPNTTIAIKGHAKELNCTARGERPIIIRWEKGDTVIDPDRNIRYTITTKDSGDEVISTLKVRDLAQ